MSYSWKEVVFNIFKYGLLIFILISMLVLVGVLIYCVIRNYTDSFTLLIPHNLQFLILITFSIIFLSSILFGILYLAERWWIGDNFKKDRNKLTQRKFDDYNYE